MQTPITLELDRRGIPYRTFTHPGPLRSLEQAAEERGQRPEQVIRSILFRVADGEYVLVLVAGPEQISWPALRTHLGVRRISMASPEEVMQITNCPVGAVSPFGLPAPLRILADESIFAPEEISIGSGLRGTTVFMQTADLRRALGEVEMIALRESQ